MKLSANFTLEEMIFSRTADRLGVDNTPPQEAIDSLKAVANALETIRKRIGAPILISSGYRSQELNKKIPGSAKNSAHTRGAAVDFIAPAYGDPLKICKEIMNSGLMFDQLIYEGTWVHLGIEPPMRRQVLTRVGNEYVSGLVA